MKVFVLALAVMSPACAERALDVPIVVEKKTCDRSVPLEDLCAAPPADESLPDPPIIPAARLLQVAPARCVDDATTLASDWTAPLPSPIAFDAWPSTDYTELLVDGAGNVTWYENHPPFSSRLGIFAPDGSALDGSSVRSAMLLAHDGLVSLDVDDEALRAWAPDGTQTWETSVADTWASLSGEVFSVTETLPYGVYDVAVDRVLLGPFSATQGVAVFDASSGDLAWSRALALPYSAIAGDENGFYLDQVSGNNRCLVALDQCGQARWAHALGASHSVFGVAVDSGRLYGFDGFARSTDDGHAIAGVSPLLPVIDDRRVYGVVVEGATNELIAFDVATNTALWARKLPVGFAFASSLQLTEDDGVMFMIVSDTGKSELRALDADGNDVWSCRLEGHSPTAFILDGAHATVAEAPQQLSRYTPPGMPRAATKGWVRWGGGPGQGRHGL